MVGILLYFWSWSRSRSKMDGLRNNDLWYRSYLTFFFCQVIGQVEKLSHVTDNIQSKAEQILALVNGLELGEVVKTDGGKGA